MSYFRRSYIRRVSLLSAAATIIIFCALDALWEFHLGKHYFLHMADQYGSMPYDHVKIATGILLLAALIPVGIAYYYEWVLVGGTEDLGVLLYDLPEIIYRSDTGGRLYWISPKSEEMLGYTLRDVHGRTLDSLFINQDDRKRFRELIRQEAAIYNFETRIIKKKGGAIWVSISARFFPKGLPKEIGFEGSIRDISDFKQSQLERDNAVREIEAIFAVMPDIFYQFDTEGRLQKWNRRMEEMTGLGASELRGRFIRDMVSSGEGDCIWSAFEEVFKKGSHWIEGHMLDSHGRLVPYHFSGAALKNDVGKVVGMVGVGRDVTELRQGENNLRMAKERAENATLEKDRYLSLIAHDLKTPFGSVIGLLRLLEADEESALSDTYRQRLAATLEISERTVTLIDSLLDVSRFSTGSIQMHKKFVDARNVFSLAGSGFTQLSHEKRITLINDIPEGMRLYVDPPLFGEVIQNLLSNAIKFCSPGDTIRLLAPEGGSRPVIAVEDSGVGIAAEDLESLFSSENRLSRTGTAGEKGTGLGLAFAQRIVASHGGQLTVTSQVGVGSRFTVRLVPVRPQVLVVDDDPSVRLVVAELLEPLDVDVIEAEDGQKALESIQRQLPHLIICDINMPRMDGLRLLRLIREDRATAGVPVIINTADARMQTRSEAIRLGADDFLSINMAEDELIPRVRKHLA